MLTKIFILNFVGSISIAIAATRPANTSITTLPPVKCALLEEMVLNTTDIYGFEDRRDRLAGGAVIVAALTSMGNDFSAINRNITEEYRQLFGDLGWSTASGLDADSWDVDVPASSPGFIRGRVAGKRVTISRPKRSPSITPEVELIRLASNSSAAVRWIGGPVEYDYDTALVDQLLIIRILRGTSSSSLSSLSVELEREFNFKYGGVWMCIVSTSPAAFTFRKPAGIYFAKILAIEFGPLSIFMNNIASLGPFCPTMSTGSTAWPWASETNTVITGTTTTTTLDPLSAGFIHTSPIGDFPTCAPQVSDFEVISRATAAANRNTSEIIYHGGTNKSAGFRMDSLDYNGDLSTAVFTNAITQVLNNSYNAPAPTLLTFKDVAAAVKNAVYVLMAGNSYVHRNYIVGRENIISQGFIYAPTIYAYSIRFDELYITWWVASL